MKIRLISVGRDRSNLFEPAVQDYASRIKRYAPFELLELAESKAAEEAKRKEEEARLIVGKLKPGEKLWLLDEHGTQPDSVELAGWLAKALNEGKDLTLAIGGAAGHGPAAFERADKQLSLSKLTLAHRLARVVLVEQLYRAFTILRNEPYHRA